MEPLRIDGAEGEGGGQIVRTALGLSLVTGREVRLRNIRARRARPGLLRQHLTAVEAAARIGDARVEGARLGSTELAFAPGRVRAGDSAFDVGTAGSVTLVLQTVLPALLVADAPSRVTLFGGTHNPLAPPFDFLARVFVPAIARMGARVRLDLVRHGFFPAGGGEVRAEVVPSPLAPLLLLQRGEILRRRAEAVVANLPLSIAERELRAIGWDESVARPVESAGPGNVVMLHVESEHASELVTGFGARGVPAERVAQGALAGMERYLAADVPVGEHLADQLLVPMALAGGGAFRTMPLSSHARTNAALIERFLPVRFAFEAGVLRIEGVRGR
ncbi:MAG TPA: RNA 3'-terminal phosphate cyclase [Planctomycetota bacterium]|nr:RNA 3'-terminal phosphate cyclase [Planctomycetota bacterium]